MVASRLLLAFGDGWLPSRPPSPHPWPQTSFALCYMLPTFPYFGGISPEPQLFPSWLAVFLPLTGLQIYALTRWESHSDCLMLPTGGARNSWH